MFYTYQGGSSCTAQWLSEILLALIFFDIEKELKVWTGLSSFAASVCKLLQSWVQRHGKGYLKLQLINQRSDFSFALFSGGLSNECSQMSISAYLHDNLFVSWRNISYAMKYYVFLFSSLKKKNSSFNILEISYINNACDHCFMDYSIYTTKL